MPLFSLGERRPKLLGSHHYVAHDATLVGDITLHNNVNVWFQVVIRAENDRIVIGEDCNIQDASVLHVDPGFPMTLAPRVSIGHKVMLHGCTIGENSLIGINAVVLNGAKIGRNCLIGANALITEGKEIPDNSMVLGAPGKVVRELTEQQIQGLRSSALHYVENARRFKRDLQPQLAVYP